MAFANFNPYYPLHLVGNLGNWEMIGHNGSTAGGGLEYRCRLNRHLTMGSWYGQNDSDGWLTVPNTPLNQKLPFVGTTLMGPQMRYELAILATETLRAGRLSPFMSEGPGVIMTYNHTAGFQYSGFSVNPAFVFGPGTDVALGKNLKVRTGVTFFAAKNGCYCDPKCTSFVSLVKDVRFGVVYHPRSLNLEMWAKHRGFDQVWRYMREFPFPM